MQFPWVRTCGRAAWLAGAGVVVLICWLTCFVGLEQSSLWRSQEGRIGVVARHMVTSGNWVLPEAEEGKVCTGKPVLYHWLVALLGAGRGFDEVTVRAPAAAAALLTALLVYGWASGLQSRGGALVSALVLVTGVKFMVMGRMARVDMLLVLWVTVSYLCFYLGYRRCGQRRRWFLLMYAAMALAMMTKGPIGVALPLVGILVFLVVRRDLRLLKQLELFWGAVLFLAIAGPWYIAVSVATRGQFLVSFFGYQNLSRFLGTQVGASPARSGEPWWYYGPHLLLALMPWTPMLVCALTYHLWPRRHARESTDPAEACSSGFVGPARTLACCWFLTGLVFFSISRGKRSDYLLPLFPGLALLVGAFWESAYVSKATPSKRLAGVAAVLEASLLVLVAIVALLMAVVAPLSDWWRGHLQGLFLHRNPAMFAALVEAFQRHMATGILVFVGAAVTAWLWWGLRSVASKKRALAAVALTVGLVLLGQTLYRHTLAPLLDERYGSRSVAGKMRPLIPPQQPLTLLGIRPHSLVFYLDRTTTTLRARDVNSLASAAAAPAPFYCLTSAAGLKRLPGDVRGRLRVLYRSPRRDRSQYVLLTNDAE